MTCDDILIKAINTYVGFWLELSNSSNIILQVYPSVFSHSKWNFNQDKIIMQDFEIPLNCYFWRGNLSYELTIGHFREVFSKKSLTDHTAYLDFNKSSFITDSVVIFKRQLTKGKFIIDYTNYAVLQHFSYKMKFKLTTLSTLFCKTTHKTTFISDYFD